ncbi:methionine-R-sulfoxide reductase [Nitzschia inconspicua]|uniref:Peptide-methionine (R)-S-oxide reductase n=1 Tax=Nitzschia inconspicua TaxID=303405 RepID=A0A9K3PJ46_9STRA|nr:methionine-R-sulfoxide reductase [Nitzschia inconspicua]
MFLFTVTGEKDSQRFEFVTADPKKIVIVAAATILILASAGVDGFLVPKAIQVSRRHDNFIRKTPFDAKSHLAASTKSRPVEKTDQEWQEILTPDQYYVLRKEGTETPGASELNYVKEPGTFVCAGCGAPLFVTDTKFDSGTGWPSFFAPISSSAIDLDTDFKLLLPRTECSCSQCGGHLGHVFEDGPEPTGQRYCMNGVAMKFFADQERPDLVETVKQQQTNDPFRPSPSQLLPTAIVNGIISAFFVGSFLSSQQTTPIEYLTLLPGLYYGFVSAKNIAKML